ncbi:helix-turn-helix transcriptional regulator [Pseudomonas sp. SC11]|uniref:helix-turn-helix transcriptional regulator n=1 Tax=Pseudomonas sp. SC11 TaxID=326927 RepID=UPI00399BD446
MAAADDDLGSAARTVLSKISVALKQPPKEAGAATLRALGNLPDSSRRHLGVLRRAIEQRAALKISYRRMDGELSQRLIRPLGLFYWGGKWTVGSWCEARAAYRDFRVDRIIAVAVATQTFPDNPAVDLRLYMNHQASQWRAITGTDNTVSV